MPAESKEGDILDIAITRDVQETEAAKERVSSLLMKLKKRIRIRIRVNEERYVSKTL